MLTEKYTRIHAGLQRVAEEYGTTAAALRTLLALYEVGRPCMIDELGRLLGTDGSTYKGSQVRRSLQLLYAAGWADGHPRKQGTPTLVQLTEAGRELGHVVWLACNARVPGVQAVA